MRAISAGTLKVEVVEPRFVGSRGGRPSNGEGMLCAQEIERGQNDSGRARDGGTAAYVLQHGLVILRLREDKDLLALSTDSGRTRRREKDTEKSQTPFHWQTQFPEHEAATAERQINIYGDI
jgi:hypothetical protein